MSVTILLCTVGGSHRPILKAIESASPGYVCFFCTGQDPGTGAAGSDRQVSGKGNVIKNHRDDEKPTLPNIPVQADLEEHSFEVQIVPADDLDKTFFVIRGAIVGLADRFPDASFIADYTGGTKTMTAALVSAALESDEVKLQLVTGARSNLVSVKDRTEDAVISDVNRLRLDRAMTPYLKAWNRFAYHEATDGLDRIRIAASVPDRTRLGSARDLSRAFAHWDDFDHASAFNLIEAYETRIAQSYPGMLGSLRLLVGECDTRHEPARLFDLWLNAERRAAQGRFDDAVARVYRLIEWTAQWQLRSKLDADTANFPAELLPANADARPDRDGKIKVPLWSAWQIVGEHVQGSARDLIVNHGAELRDLLSIRNNSILAHGFSPVLKSDWERIQGWTQDRLLPVLCDLAQEAGLKNPPDQLPMQSPEFVRETG